MKTGYEKRLMFNDSFNLAYNLDADSVVVPPFWSHIFRNTVFVGGKAVRDEVAAPATYWLVRVLE